jgi:hypothetical protein
MADQTIIASDDTYLDEGAADTVRAAIDNIQIWASGGADERNPVWKFDCSSLDGMTWGSVVLKVTWKASGTGISDTIYLSYIKQTAVEVDDCTWNSYDDSGANTWNTAGAEDSTDNDHTTRVAFDLSAAIVADVTISSDDLTDIVQKALDENSGILNLICYGVGGTQTTVRRFKSLETAGVSEADKPQLFFSGVQAAATTTTTAAVATPSGSATVSSKSARPPVQEASRQAVVAILHDGVEPMTILALITKAEYGTDA